MHAAWGEVTVMYGGTPVAVQHLRREPVRRVPAAALLGLGAVLPLAGAAGLASDVRQDWDAYTAASQAAQQRDEPGPPTPGPGLGGPGVALALLGLVPLVLGLVRRGDPRRRSFTIGEDNRASFQVPTLDLPGPLFSLLEIEAGPVLRFTATTCGELWAAGTHSTLAGLIADGRTERDEQVHRYWLVPGARVRVDHGAVSFWISAVEPETAKVARARLDGPTWFYTGSAALGLAGLLALAHWIPRSEGIEEFLYDPDASHYVGYLIMKPVPPPGRELFESEGEDAEREHGAASGSPSAHAGKAGGPGRAGRRGAAGMLPLPGRGHDPERAARSAGILGLMARDSGSGALGVGTYGDGDGEVWAGLTGAQIGASNATGGLGLAGSGPGGPLHGAGVIGLGATGLIGKGGIGGSCSECGPRDAGAGFGGRGVRVPRVHLAHATAQGALDSDIIRRVVRAHLSEIRHCYNQTLVRDPRAHGRVVVQFVIGGAGRVTSAVIGESDLRDPQLGVCAAQAVRRWSFPRPEGGGSVLVNYPFVFSTAGDSA